MILRPILSLLPLITLSKADILPQAVQWSPHSYGPDGPWLAVTISIGTPPQTISLLPGGTWESPILSPSICPSPSSSSSPVALTAGLYDPTKSSTLLQIPQTGNKSTSDYDATWMFDTMSVTLMNGVAGKTYVQEIENWDMLVISDSHLSLADGTTYPQQIGTLSLGAPEFNQSWTHYPPNPRWNGTLLPSYIYGAGLSPSNSFGLHVGSASMNIPGSLYLGGYDQSRVLGPVSAQVYDINHLPIDLLDIGIRIAEGESPFNFSSKSGLLAAGNSTIGISTTVLVQPQDPYFYLPQSTCDAITSFLPVTYSTNFGLYLWDIADPRYKTIISSPAYLEFTFRLNSSISSNLTINFPFSLLNLTLESPITATPTQYFPCKPGTGPTGSYELGRAFMQGSFVGVNWGLGSENGMWFLAQAPGPNTPGTGEVRGIGVNDNYIVGSGSEWKDSWKGVWTVLGSNSSSSSSPGNGTASSPAGNSTNQEEYGAGRLSKGVKAGIALGAVIFFALVVVGSGTMCLNRKGGREGGRGKVGRKNTFEEYSGRMKDEFGIRDWGKGEGEKRDKYRSAGFGPREMWGGGVIVRPVELP